MSSGSLISSLFRDNSFASRSNSMFHKSYLGTEAKEERSRSQATHIEKSINTNPSSKYLPVARMTHMLAVKIKKLNYFLFCRLEANLKKSRAENIDLPMKNLEKEPEVEIFQQPVVAPKIQKKANKQIINGLQSLAEIFQLNQLKQQNSICVQSTFKKIKKYSQFRQATLSVFRILSRIYGRKVSDSFKGIQSRQKSTLKAEIFIQATVHVIQPHLKKIFKEIRELAISNKIKLQIQNRQKKIQEKDRQRIKEKERFINCNELYLGVSNKKRLKSIQEQGSSMISEQQTARFATPEKSRSKKDKAYQEDLQKSKTSRKEARVPVLSRKETRRQNQESLDEKCEIFKSNSKLQQDPCESRVKSQSIRASTKKLPFRPKIVLQKSMKIETFLFDDAIIKFNRAGKNQQKQCMVKHNRLYSEALPNMLPDLHDNMGVFEQIWADESNTFSQDNAYSHRTVQKTKSQWIDIENSKTVSHCRQTEIKTVANDIFKEDRVDFYEIRNTEDITFLKQNADRNVITASSRAMTNSISSPKFCVETGINTSIHKESHNYQGRENRTNNQFHSSPLYKIEQMMIDLEKLREREKITSKYVSGYQKCKLSVNLPKKSHEGRSYQASASKSNINCSKTGLNQCRSQKKQLRRDALKRYSYKENKQHKQNIEVKLWQQKEKFQFYAEPKSIKQRKRSSGIISSLNQSEINTARKVKNQIQRMINSRKSRTSLGTLKVPKSKY